MAEEDPLSTRPATGDADAYEIVEMDEKEDHQTGEDEEEEEKSYSWHSSEEDEDEGTPIDASTTDGVLTPRLVSRGLECLGRTADGSSSCFIHCKLPNKSLVDISILAKYDQLQVLHLPDNNISDLTALSNMPYLLELDVSHNNIAKVLDFNPPPRNLVSANFSHNNIVKIDDLSHHHFLQVLILDNNEIRFIEGLTECHRMQELSLANNKITHIENLDNLPLHRLCLKGNRIAEIENLETLLVLHEVDLSWNQIKSLGGLEDHDLLHTINLENNLVDDMLQIQHLTRLANLRILDLEGNPIQNLNDYRMEVLYNIQRLCNLDKRRASTQEKVAAWNLFQPPPEVIAAQDHVRNLMYQFLQPTKVLESTLPSLETPFPMLVLVGPNGSGCYRMARRLAKDFSEYFRYAMPCSTAPPQMYESSLTDSHLNYIADDDFENDVKNGKFLVTYSVHDHQFGFQLQSLEECAVEGVACVTCMELEGVLSLKNSHHRPRYVLLLPLDPGEHGKRLRERGCLTDAQLSFELERVGVYAKYNRERPGFFDRVIDTTNVRDAYKELGVTVMEYLGVGGGVTNTAAAAANSVSTTGSTTTAAAASIGGEGDEVEVVRPETGAKRGTSVRLTGSAITASSSVSAGFFAEGESALASTSRQATAAADSISTPLASSVEAESYRRRTAAAKEVVEGRLGGGGGGAGLSSGRLFSVPPTAPTGVSSAASASFSPEEGGSSSPPATAPERRKISGHTHDSASANNNNKNNVSRSRVGSRSQVGSRHSPSSPPPTSAAAAALPPIIKSSGASSTRDSRLRGGVNNSAVNNAVVVPQTLRQNVSIHVYEASPTTRNTPASLPPIRAGN